MLQEERSDFIEQVKDIAFYLLVVDKFTFVFSSETGKTDYAVVVVKEIFSEKHRGCIGIDSILQHLEFFKNSNRVAGVCAIF